MMVLKVSWCGISTQPAVQGAEPLVGVHQLLVRRLHLVARGPRPVPDGRPRRHVRSRGCPARRGRHGEGEGMEQYICKMLASPMLVDQRRDSSLPAYFSSQRGQEESLCSSPLQLSTQSIVVWMSEGGARKRLL